LSKTLTLDSSPRVLSSRVRFFFIATQALLLLALFFAAEHVIHSMLGAHRGWINTFDMSIESHLNRLVNRWRPFDTVMCFLLSATCLKAPPSCFYAGPRFLKSAMRKTSRSAEPHWSPPFRSQSPQWLLRGFSPRFFLLGNGLFGLRPCISKCPMACPLRGSTGGVHFRVTTQSSLWRWRSGYSLLLADWVG
jgi:hypothetical protein